MRFAAAFSSVLAASANVLDIDHIQLFNQYVGDLFVGSNQIEWHVLFDTMNSWTVVTGDYN